MLELRRSPRINVTWRGLLKTDQGAFLPIRVLNVSSSGILMNCPQALGITSQYHCMLEIPHIDHIKSEPHKVPCKIEVMHCILSSDHFRIGVQFSEISSVHRDLVNAWISMASKFDPK